MGPFLKTAMVPWEGIQLQTTEGALRPSIEQSGLLLSCTASTYCELKCHRFKQVFQIPKNIKCLVKNVIELVEETALQNVRECIENSSGLFGVKKRKINLEYCIDV